MTTPIIEKEIQLLETYSKQGDSYTNNEGRYGWRNPIRSDTGDLMRCLTISVGPKRTLEFGTGHGLSALYMVSGLADFSQQHIDTIEFDAEVAKSSQARFDACQAPVTVKSGEAMDVIAQLTGHYDMVFFDA
ncbi:MAG: O-methyltransferase, partial [Flavobacteriales bacterium]